MVVWVLFTLKKMEGNYPKTISLVQFDISGGMGSL